MEGLLKELKEVSVSVLPIALIALVLGLVFHTFSTTVPIWQFLLSVVLVIFGLALFLLGVNLGFVPVGNHIGNLVTGKKNIYLLMGTGLVLGIIITMAEPDVTVLTEQIISLNSAINKTVLIMMIALGVGIFMALSYLRAVVKFSLKITMAICVALLLVVAAFVPEFFVSVAFDAGGATTGPMAVPFIMAIGLGVAASHGGSNEDSFGFAGMASIGPVLFVLILGALSGQGSAGAVTESSEALSLGAIFLEEFKTVTTALLPLVVICILVQVFFMKLPRLRAIRLFVGIAYSWFGITIFLFAVESSFMPVATALGASVAGVGNWALILVGIVLGAAVVLAEPAIWVLTEQVEDVSQGRIKRIVMLAFISTGVALAVALSMIRVIYGLSIWWFILPGYLLVILMMVFSNTLFVGIAFDSGGVATGPMSSTFLLPFVIGAASLISEDATSASFGMIGLISMMPILTIEILGAIYRATLKKAEGVAKK